MINLTFNTLTQKKGLNTKLKINIKINKYFGNYYK